MAETVAQSQPLSTIRNPLEPASVRGPETDARPAPESMGQQVPGILQRANLDIGSLAPTEILTLQRALGNGVVQRLIARDGKSQRHDEIHLQSSQQEQISGSSHLSPDISELTHTIRHDGPSQLASDGQRAGGFDGSGRRVQRDPDPSSPVPSTGPSPIAAPPGATPAAQGPTPSGASASGPAADPNAPPAVWQVPPLFGGATVNNGADASVQLIDIKSQLEPLKEQFEGIPVVFNAIDNLLPETYGNDKAGPLKPDLASKLSGAGLAAAGAYNVALDQYKAKLNQSLSLKEKDGAEAEESGAEILHATAFGKEADNEALEKAKEGFEQVHIYVEWTHYANEWVVKTLETAQSAEKFEKIAHALEGAGEFAEKASAALAALNSALAFYSAIKVSSDPGKSSAQKTGAQLKAGFSLVPVVLAGAGTVASLTANATGLGLLWSTLVPQTEAALHMLEQVDEQIAAHYKSQAAEEWWDEARKEGGGKAPQLPADQISHFPGGQETLDFMWAIFKGSPPEKAPAQVEKFFYETREKMNKKHQGGEELETEWHLFSPNEVKNLIPWVQANKEEVWGMLYGSLPHP